MTHWRQAGDANRQGKATNRRAVMHKCPTVSAVNPMPRAGHSVTSSRITARPATTDIDERSSKTHSSLVSSRNRDFGASGNSVDMMGIRSLNTGMSGVQGAHGVHDAGRGDLRREFGDPLPRAAPHGAPLVATLGGDACH